MKIKTLTELLQAHLAYQGALNTSRYTLRGAYYHVTSLLRWLASTHSVKTAKALTRDHLEGWQHHLSARRTSKGLRLKARSINRNIEHVRNFLKYLVVHGQLASPLAEVLCYVKEPRLLPTSILPHGEVKQMLSRIPTTDSEGYRDRVMLELLYSSGMRAGELLALNLADIDLVHATALVMGKGSKQRVVPMGKIALALLQGYLQAIRPSLVKEASQQALFLNHHGRRMPYHTFRRLVHQYTEQVGLSPKVTPHTFRRSCTTELIRAGANLYHVKELLGHASLETLQHYARLTIADLKKTHQKCHPRERDKEGF